ncbi:MAG: 4Fe-4S double cluster binding domain-containing protein [Bacteroidales bacterium]|nr:4Fe-4S double cluster binding domain-containing protein [Bacteroidales bacterium]
MKPSEIISSIFSYIVNEGYVAKVMSAEHLKELEDELTLRKRTDHFDENFYKERLTSFKYTPDTVLPDARSIIIIAVPQPTVVLIFRWNGTDQQVIIPPTYDFSANAEMKRRLKEILIPEGYNLFTTSVPLKLIAVRSGLAEYGRNNICYIPGRGSFFRLMAFLTDLPCAGYTWRPPVMMERCLNCKTCLVSCPLGAIDEHRFLLYAERCLTFHNEHAGGFPKNIDPSFHDCLFGCLRCQTLCPENKKTFKWMEERERFSEYETLVILNGIPLDQIPNSTQKKLSRLGLIDDYSLLARNLSVLLN